MVSRLWMCKFLFAVGIPLLILGLGMFSLIAIRSRMKRNLRRATANIPGDEVKWTKDELLINKRNLISTIGDRDLDILNLKLDISSLKKQKINVIKNRIFHKSNFKKGKLNPDGGPKAAYKAFQDLENKIIQKNIDLSALKKAGIIDLSQLGRINKLEKVSKNSENVIKI